MLAAVPLAVVARAWPRIAIAEALAISAVFQVQLALPSPLRHFEPLVLAALACTAAAAMTHRKHSRRERSSQPMDPGGTTQRHSWPAARAIRSKSAS